MTEDKDDLDMNLISLKEILNVAKESFVNQISQGLIGDIGKVKDYYFKLKGFKFTRTTHVGFIIRINLFINAHQYLHLPM